MGKRIVSQARGHGSLVYQVRSQGYIYKISYPKILQGKAKILQIIHSPAHSAPVLKLQMDQRIFYNLAFNNAYEGQEISIGKKEEIQPGDITELKNLKTGANVYNIEVRPLDGGKLVRSGGSFAEVSKREGDSIFLMMPSKRLVPFNENCRATVGIIAGSGKNDKPFLKAGRRFHAMRARGKRWHFTSKVKVNSIDHPFGGGRGKRIKSKIAKRNAPPGARVGHLRPRRTGRK